MENQQHSYLDVTLKKDEIIISFGTIFKMLKKFLAFWLVLAILAAILIPVGSAIFASDQHKNLQASVSFNYDGIEKGLTPDGKVFDATTLKNPAVIEAALTELDLPLTTLETIRQNITITGVIPANAVDKINTYKSVFEQGNLQAGVEMISTEVYPTQYTVSFNYAATGFSGEKAVEFLNTMLSAYREYFFEQYGFNAALGNAVMAFDYTTYDYAPAMDVFASSLDSLKDYVNDLAEQDQTHFRSSKTGYTFADLSAAIDTVETVDLDQLVSYITVNNVTKDKNKLMNYYTYKIQELAKKRSEAEKRLEQLEVSIATYEKDVTIIYGDQEDAQYSQPSATYDDMFTKQIAATDTVASTTQEISMYQERVNALKSKSAADEEMMQSVDEQMTALNNKIVDLLNKVNDTANEYYETVYLGNAYTILVPATTSAISTATNVMKSSAESILICEAILFVLYLGVAFVYALVIENRKKKEETAALAAEGDSVDAEEQTQAEES